MRTFSKWSIIFWSLYIASEATSFAFSFPSIKNVAQIDYDKNLFSDAYDFNGIVALSNCSGSLIRYEQSELDDQGIILTNGHCVGMLDPNTSYYKKPSSRRFNLLNSRGNSIGRVTARQLQYATMSKTDLALYELRKTYREIEEEYGIEAFTLSPSRADVGDGIQIISGYWRRGYECSIEHIVHRLKESHWIFHDSLRYSRPGCETIGGTSGSPIILTGTKTIIGINNTGNESGKKCSLNNPCEIDDLGSVLYKRGYSYGQQTDIIYSCLDDNLEIDLEKESCQLIKGEIASDA